MDELFNILSLDENEINTYDEVCSFDPSVFGDDESLKVSYNFPSERMSGIRR